MQMIRNILKNHNCLYLSQLPLPNLYISNSNYLPIALMGYDVDPSYPLSHKIWCWPPPTLSLPFSIRLIHLFLSLSLSLSHLFAAHSNTPPPLSHFSMTSRQIMSQSIIWPQSKVKCTAELGLGGWWLDGWRWRKAFIGCWKKKQMMCLLNALKIKCKL